jgi:hypothetical protein
MNRLTQTIEWPYDWKACDDQGRYLWTETYRGGLILTIRRASSEQLLAMLDRGQSKALRDYLVEAFPLPLPALLPASQAKSERRVRVRGSNR